MGQSLLIDSIDLQSLLDQAVGRHFASGVSVSIWHQGKEVRANSGVLSVHTDYRVSDDSLFQIGSVTKVLTATLMMILVDQERIELDAPVRRYLPDFRIRDIEASQKITIKQLLCHSSGMAGDFMSDTGSGNDRLVRFVDRCALLPLAHPVGDGFSYSNSAYCLAGRVIEVVSGLPFDRAMETLLFRPMGLENAFCDAYAMAGRAMASGHSPGADDPKDPARLQRIPSLYTLPPSGSPAGATTAMSASDLAHFGRMHLNGGVADNGTRILSETAVALMQRTHNTVPVPPRDIAEWGLGWFKLKPAGGELIGHDGNTVGQSAYLRIHPSSNTVAVVLANGESVYDLASEIFDATLDRLTGIVPSAAPKPISIDVSDLQKYVGVYQSMMGETRISIKNGVLIREGEMRLDDLLIADKPQPLCYAGQHNFLMYHPPAVQPGLLSFLEPNADGIPQVLFSGLRIARRVA